MTTTDEPGAAPSTTGEPGSAPAVSPAGTPTAAAEPDGAAPSGPPSEPGSSPASAGQSSAAPASAASGNAPLRSGSRPRRRRDRRPVFVVLASLLAGTAGGTAAAWLVAGEARTPVVRTVVQPSGPGGEDPGAALPALVTRVTRSVVALDMLPGPSDPAFGSTGAASGTGFVLAADGLIATTAHVVAGAGQITVTFQDGTRAPATVAGADSLEDLAVLRVHRTGLTPLPLAADHLVKVGEFVVATGNALSLEGSPTVTVGIISALNRSITLTDGRSLAHLLQTDAAISAGDSGGPLLSASGAVIGINTATASSSSAQNIGFAIPMSRAEPILMQLAARS